MPAHSAVQTGRMHPEEWINGPSMFFPFRTTGSSHGLLLNKCQVLAVTVGPEAEDDPTSEGEAPVRRVTVEAGDRVFAGSVVIDMPVNQQRVVDYVNRPEAFLLLRGDGRHFLIRKDLISRLLEVEGV